jgi:hypothetical protein
VVRRAVKLADVTTLLNAIATATERTEGAAETEGLIAIVFNGIARTAAKRTTATPRARTRRGPEG